VRRPRRCAAPPTGPTSAELRVQRNEHTVEIAAPPAVVFPWLVGSAGRLRWMGALVESEALDEGRPQVGSRFRDVFENLGQRIELEAELVELDPPRALAVHLVADALEATSRSRLEATEGGSRLTATIETTYKARGARLVAPIVSRRAQRQLEDDLARLKELVERGEEPAPAG
jgi:uncharacterized protein YndB with AHSA1/START domain